LDERENPSSGSSWAPAPEKKSKQDRTVKEKRHNSVIFHISGEKLPLMILQPNLALGRRGSDFTGGRILAFSIDFAYGP